MKDFIKKYAYSFYLGGSLALLGADFLHWQYWAVMMPMVILVELKANK